MSTQLSSLDLYNLVHSLTGTEKKIFKAHCNLDGRKQAANYLALFNIYNSQKVYSKDELKQKTKKLKVYSTNVLQHNLYKVLMRTLRYINNNLLVESDIYKLMQDAEILYQKNHFRLSYKILKKAEALALKKNTQHLLPLIYAEQSKVITRIDELFNQIENEKIFQSFVLSQERTNIMQELRYLFLKQISIFRNPNWTENTTEVYSIINHKLVSSSDSLLLSDTAIIFKKIILAHHERNFGGFKRSCEYIKEAYQLALKYKQVDKKIYMLVLLLFIKACEEIYDGDQMKKLLVEYEKELSINNLLNASNRLKISLLN